MRCERQERAHVIGAIPCSISKRESVIGDITEYCEDISVHGYSTDYWVQDYGPVRENNAKQGHGG